MSNWQNYPVERANQQGTEIDAPITVANLADEAEDDRAAGMPTVGTRGFADTKAFEQG